MEQIVRAYRTMQQADHIGKIVVNLPPWSGARSIDAPDAFKRDATYLITGAFGGIGLRLAEWLCHRGARHLALIGRRAPQAAAAEHVAQLEAAGIRICVAICDVASEEQVSQLFSRDLTQMPPLRGVFHLAGALDDGALIQQSWPRFETVFAPKVIGAWNLHCQTRQMPLDCFVLFSSWASFLGSQGQANHSAANAFMDALAWQRRAAGLPGLSINWGAWAEIGAATKGDAAEHLARRGIGSFSPEMGLRALGYLMSQGGIQVAVTPFDLEKWRQASASAERSDWFEFLDQATDNEKSADDLSVVDLKQALLAATPGKQRYLVMEAFLKELVGKTLRMPVTRIDADKPFKSFGMDSLTALEFRNRIEASIEATLSATLVWNYPTINKLAFYLFDKMSISIDQESETAPSSPSEANGDEALLDINDEIENLPEDQVRQLLLDGE
jgi:acyl carrier protein